MVGIPGGWGQIERSVGLLHEWAKGGSLEGGKKGKPKPQRLVDAAPKESRVGPGRLPSLTGAGRLVAPPSVLPTS